MKVHVISETPFIMKATGVHTAFMEHIELLREKDDVQVVINDEGTGDIFHGHTYGKEGNTRVEGCLQRM